MTDIKRKLSSRKFWVALAGVLSGVGIVISGNVQEGVVLIATTVLGYLAAEGIIDAKTKNTATEIIDVVADNLSKSTTKSE